MPIYLNKREAETAAMACEIIYPQMEQQLTGLDKHTRGRSLKTIETLIYCAQLFRAHAAGRKHARLKDVPAPLSADDARRAAMGCRSLAHIRRKDAEASTDAVGRNAMLAEAAKLEELAARFEAYAAAPAPSPKPPKGPPRPA